MPSVNRLGLALLANGFLTAISSAAQLSFRRLRRVIVIDPVRLAPATMLLLVTAESPAATPFMAEFTEADGATALHAQLINPNGVEGGGEYPVQGNSVHNAVDGFGHQAFGW